MLVVLRLQNCSGTSVLKDTPNSSHFQWVLMNAPIRNATKLVTSILHITDKSPAKLLSPTDAMYVEKEEKEDVFSYLLPVPYSTTHVFPPLHAYVILGKLHTFWVMRLGR